MINDEEIMDANEKACRRSASKANVSMSNSMPRVKSLAKEQAYKAPRQIPGNLPAGKKMG